MADQHNNEGASHQRREGGNGNYRRGGNDRGGYKGSCGGDNRGGYKGGKGGYGRRDDHNGGNGGKREGGYGRRDDRNGGQRRDGGRGNWRGNDGEKRDFRGRDDRRDNRGYKGGRDGENRGGYRGDRDRNDRGPKRDFNRDRNDRGPKRDFNRGPKRDFDRNGARPQGGPRRDGDAERTPKPDFRGRNTTRDPRRKPEQAERGGKGAPRGNKPAPRMRKNNATPARLAALEVVRTVRERQAFAQDVIAKVIDHSSMSVEDRAFATLLALGTVSARGTLDEIIDRALDTPEDVFRETRDALQISVYELIFLGKEAHAAVDQGVEMVKSFSPGPAARVANAVLHKVVRLRLDFPFGNPATDIDALARTQAFPTWMVRKLMADLGPQAAIDFMRASNEPAPLFVAVNACKVTDDHVLKAFERAEEVAEPVSLGDIDVPGCLRVPESRALLVPALERQIDQGKMLVSDAAAQMVAANILPDEKPASVLEVGAGRATKTILLQSNACRKYGSQIEEYVTIDNHAYKTRLLEKRAEDYGVNVTEAFTGNALDLDNVMPERLFDLVFVDAPCSGMGTLRRHPEIRWRMAERDVENFAKTQLGMLKAAATHIKPGGMLAYSTCTVTREENAGVVKAFLDSAVGKHFKLDKLCGRNALATRLAPGSSDAHFAVRLLRDDAPVEQLVQAAAAEAAQIAAAEAAKAAEEAAKAAAEAAAKAAEMAEAAAAEAAQTEVEAEAVQAEDAEGLDAIEALETTGAAHVSIDDIVAEQAEAHTRAEHDAPAEQAEEPAEQVAEEEAATQEDAAETSGDEEDK